LLGSGHIYYAKFTDFRRLKKGQSHLAVSTANPVNNRLGAKKFYPAPPENCGAVLIPDKIYDSNENATVLKTKKNQTLYPASMET